MKVNTNLMRAVVSIDMNGDILKSKERMFIFSLYIGRHAFISVHQDGDPSILSP